MAEAWQFQFRGLCEDLGFALGMAVGWQEAAAGEHCAGLAWLCVSVQQLGERSE
jgi:hypothetical protein